MRIAGVQSLKDLVSYLGTVMVRLKERRRREEDLEEGEDLDNNEDDVFSSVEFEVSSPVFTERVFYNILICTRLIVISSPGFTHRILYTNQILAYPMVVSFIWWGDGVLHGTGAQYVVHTIEFLYYVLFTIVLIPFRLSCDALA